MNMVFKVSPERRRRLTVFNLFPPLMKTDRGLKRQA